MYTETNDNIGRLLNMSEASQKLNLKEHQFKHLFYNINQKKAPEYVKLGKRVYFTEQALQEFVKNNTIREV